MKHSALPARFGRSAALLIVDMISDFEFEDGDRLFSNTLEILEPLAALKVNMRARGIPVIYVNDELGDGSDRLIEDIGKLGDRSDRASQILELLAPDGADHWIVKPQRSGFYATRLGNLLLSLNVSSVVVAGVTTDICVFFTAHDAYMRGYSLWIPSDCCAAVEASHHDDALSFIRRVADADTTPIDRPLMRAVPQTRTSGRRDRPSDVMVASVVSGTLPDGQTADIQ
jgi:nicotinamidase-related amidase